MSVLSKLRQRLAGRQEDRKRQLKLLRRTHKSGYAKAAARNGRAIRKLRGLISKAKRAAERNDGKLSSVKLRGTALGPPHWGGGADIMGQFVAPFMAEKFGLAKGSGKRTPQHNAEVGGAENSDHLTTRTETFARDFPTFSGEAAARALAAAFGWHDWSANSYATFDFHLGGHTFQIQILWGAEIQHGDHVHVGIELVG
jgi:hypothetical protein